MAVKEQKTLRVGVIGCGGIANGKHIPNLNANKNVELVAFCDIIEERAVESAKKSAGKTSRFIRITRNC